MPTWLEAYAVTLHLWGGMGGLLLLQLIVLDVAGIRAKHAPGTPVPADPQNFLFRAARAHANTNESLGAFILISLFAVTMQTNPLVVNSTVALYVGARVAHMWCYYAAFARLRSLSFGISLIALVILLVAGIT